MKILLVDDEILIREGLKILLSTYEDIEVVGTCSNGEEAYDFCRKNTVDVVLMDIRMDVCDGVKGTKLIREFNKQIKVLILTTFKDNEYIESAMSYGASGYLLKDSSSDKIYSAIKSAHMGNVVVHPEIASQMLQKEDKSNARVDLQEIMSQYQLTEKDISIIRQIAMGHSNKEISENLFLAEGTVKNNISQLLSKLALRDRTQIAIFAFQKKIIQE